MRFTLNHTQFRTRKQKDTQIRNETANSVPHFRTTIFEKLYSITHIAYKRNFSLPIIKITHTYGYDLLSVIHKVTENC